MGGKGKRMARGYGGRSVSSPTTKPLPTPSHSPSLPPGEPTDGSNKGSKSWHHPEHTSPRWADIGPAPQSAEESLMQAGSITLGDWGPSHSPCA